MKLQQAREDVIQAGRRLIGSGLISRTWGNVSARLDGDFFVITPSGRPYEALTPAEIVTVNIADGSYDGGIEPSTEKGIHAAIYRRRPGINFIVHTHQVFASVVSALHRDIEMADAGAVSIAGDSTIPCAAYGLPGTGKLKRNVVAALNRSEGKALLMANHGALCLGADSGEAFSLAARLEQICADYIIRRYLYLSGREEGDWDGLRACYLAGCSPEGGLVRESARRFFYRSERKGDHFVLYPGVGPDGCFPDSESGSIRISLGRSPGRTAAPPESEIHRLLYCRFKDIGAVTHAFSPDILALSQTGQTVYPLLDDFAQIVGVSVRTAADIPLPAAAGLIAGKMRGRSAVMIEGSGVLCCGPSKSDAAAAVQVLDKGCRAVIGTALFGGARPIAPAKALWMRHIYLTRYARKAAGRQT